MIFENKTNLALAVGLAALAGFTDAVGFRTLGGFFVSFMTGNSTRLAVNLAELDLTALALLPLGIIALFVCGVMAGAVVRGRSPARKGAAVMGLVAACLITAATLSAFGRDTVAVILLILAMGASNNVFVREGEVSIGVTYMTGTLVKLGQRLASGFAGGGAKPWFPYLALWLGLITGAVTGSYSYTLLGLACLWIASGLACTLLLSLLYHRPLRGH